MTTITLPRPNGTVVAYTLGPPSPFALRAEPPRLRVAYAAAHVVCDPLADVDPTLATRLDWDATLRYRHYLWDLGFGVAEAMDTAQRGMGLDWPLTQELIRRSLKEAQARGALIACGAGTDQLVPNASLALNDVIAAYEAQCALIEGHGGQVILMASRALAAVARGPDDYLRVYERVLEQLARPAILHWLGTAFDPQLANYWGAPDVPTAMEVCLSLIKAQRAKVAGIKLSLLDAEHEIAMRRQLPHGVRMFTGDDFNYVDLIAGDEQGHSDALLGVFDAIAPAAAAGLYALDNSDIATYRAVLEPTLPLARHMFRAPTYYYKTGVVFLAYLNGHQEHFRMVGGLESARSVVHLAELFVLVDQARVLRDPEQAVERMQRVLAVAGMV